MKQQFNTIQKKHTVFSYEFSGEIMCLLLFSKSKKDCQ